MNKKIIKANLLKAMKITYLEYVNKTHNLKTTDCALCKLYRDHYACDCTICPMRLAFVRCGNRNCYPVDCRGDYDSKLDYKKRLKAVTLFYELAIIAVEKKSAKELLESNFDFLLAIDRKVSDEIFNSNIK
jgi:hypothetical protein